MITILDNNLDKMIIFEGELFETMDGIETGIQPLAPIVVYCAEVRLSHAQKPQEADVTLKKFFYPPGGIPKLVSFVTYLVISANLTIFVQMTGHENHSYSRLAYRADLFRL
ncbi:MAG: hypothetical protein ACLTSL_00425 [Odoribacter splanchnicus]